MNRVTKPTQEYYFDPYSDEIQGAIDDLEKYLDDTEAREILMRLMTNVYKDGFCDGLDYIRWLEG